MRLLLFLFPLVIASASEDPLSAIARAFFSEDLIRTHLTSDFISNSSSVSPCHNFYRHLCPADFPKGEAILQKLTAQLEAVVKVEQFLTPTPEDHTFQRVEAAAAADRYDYSDTRGIERVLRGLSDNLLSDLWMEIAPLLPNRRRVQDPNRRRAQEDPVLVALAISRDREFVLRTFSQNLSKFMSDDFAKQEKVFEQFEKFSRDEQSMIRLAKREGIEHEAARRRTEALIQTIIDEYAAATKAAPSASREDRFGQAKAHVLASYLRNITYFIPFANRFSMPESRRDMMLAGYQYRVIKNYKEALLGLARLPKLRVLFAKLFATKWVQKTFAGPQMIMEREFPAGHPNAAAMRYLDDTNPPSIFFMPFFTIHIALSSKLPGLIGFTGFTFAHEMYHQVQYAHQYVEHLEEYQESQRCVYSHMDEVCRRFGEVSCASKFTEREDSPDVYGAQITFRALQKMLGAEIEAPAYADLPTTNRQLFYLANAASICMEDLKAQWRGIGDDHNGLLYRANGLAAALPDFRRAFGCHDDDPMVFPESQQCRIFS